MPDPVVNVSVSALQALHVELLTAAAELAGARRELRRLREEEFVEVRFDVEVAAAGKLKSAAATVAGWLTKATA